MCRGGICNHTDVITDQPLSGGGIWERETFWMLSYLGVFHFSSWMQGREAARNYHTDFDFRTSYNLHPSSENDKVAGDWVIVLY